MLFSGALVQDAAKSPSMAILEAMATIWSGDSKRHVSVMRDTPARPANRHSPKSRHGWLG